MTASAPWWPGVTSDRLYPYCPHRHSDAPQGVGEVDPNGFGVCGWCRGVWTARNRKAAS